MKETLRSPWLTVILTIIVMSVGYITYMHNNGSISSASAYTCPAREICDTGACADNNCTDEQCVHCEGCKNRAS